MALAPVYQRPSALTQLRRHEPDTTPFCLLPRPPGSASVPLHLKESTHGDRIRSVLVLVTAFNAQGGGITVAGFEAAVLCSMTHQGADMPRRIEPSCHFLWRTPEHYNQLPKTETSN
ncbi:hypothetical protein E2C01_100590 [Portunus trituberculatus]|uniref:Uncharacterized protein n=1 Tax=Portunus trituberculatus TaxID=210409 RepID=A0A5B7KIC1_PORTR|nr:hypothetical protein [Portunus trituberculatus]